MSGRYKEDWFLAYLRGIETYRLLDDNLLRSKFLAYLRGIETRGWPG